MDSFIQLHWVPGAPVFDLGQGARFVSIRDQMVRAKLFADHLPEWLEKHYGSFSEANSLPILVAGGGACGLTAAITLARKGQRVWVAERAEKPFPLQTACSSRWIDPSQYDWPMEHWLDDDNSWTSTTSGLPPLPWSANFADQIVRRDWIPALRGYMRDPELRGRIIPKYGFDLNPKQIFYGSGELHVDLRNLGQTKPMFQKFRAVVWARGFGKERCDCGSYKGYRFWDTDPFAEPNFGLPAQNPQTQTVLISGGGDGALQDLLRVLTGKRSARDIFTTLELQPLLDKMGKALLQMAALEWDRERVANGFEAGRFEKHDFQALDASCRALVQGILESGGDSLRDRIRALTKSRPAETIVVCSQPAFTCLYPLNRFLSLLLIEALANDRERPVQAVFNHRLDDVRNPNDDPEAPPDRTCSECLGLDWIATLSNKADKSKREITANVLIIRNGLDDSDREKAASSFLVKPSLPSRGRPMN